MPKKWEAMLLNKMAAKKQRLFNGNADIMRVFESEISKVEKTLDQIDLIYNKDLPFLDKLSDIIAHFGGSWTFITFFFCVLIGWIVLNAFILVEKPLDPFPFILLNLCLSALAAFQAPVILMAQNRAARRDQARAELDLEKDIRDLQVDQKTHEILKKLQKDVEEMKKKKK